MQEKLIGDILVALTKFAGGEITLTQADLLKEPNEIVFIYDNQDGSFTLRIKDMTTIENA